jgi:hypothetical protein
MRAQNHASETFSAWRPNFARKTGDGAQPRCCEHPLEHRAVARELQNRKRRCESQTIAQRERCEAQERKCGIEPMETASE